jgi:hypothetical protein
MASDYVFSFSSEKLKKKKYLDDSHQAEYLIRYLAYLNAKTCVLEDKYVDKDYLVDYQKFYSRSFDEDGKFTTRIHFFEAKFSKDEFEETLENNDTEYLRKSYLGFVVIRPIKGSDRKRLIGRTILKAYPEKEDSQKRVFVRDNYDVSLFGIPLSINSLPFQVQDQGVSACATIALWTALHPLAEPYGISRLSPAEITELATAFPSESRKFPSSGLILEQMINCVKSMELDVETINVENINDDEVILTAIKAYVKANLLLIGALKLTKKNGNETGYHAVTISGYRCDTNGKLTELYVHDDQIGPYHRVKPDGCFTHWKNEWTDRRGYDEVILEKMLIPIYPKIRLPFARIYPRYLEIKDRINNNFGDELDLELYLTTITKYKAFLLESTLKGKRKVLITSLPRFLWVLRSYSDGKPLKDLVFDGTSIYPKPLTSVEFKV